MLRETQKLATLLGINNRTNSRELEVFREGRPAGRFLRNAVNVDLTDNGTAKRRRGYEQVLALAGSTHIWSDGDYCYVTAAGTLYRYDAAGVSAITTVQHPRPSFCKTPLGIVVSDLNSLRLLSAGSATVLSLPPPSPVPTISAGSGGLPAGQYIVTFANAIPTLLSGCTEPQTLTLADGASIVITLPASAYPTVVYVSHPDGEVPYRRLVIPAGVTTATHFNDAVAFEPAPSMFQVPVPAGVYMTMHGSRLFSAVSNALFYSEPFKYGMRKRTNYISFEHEITGVASLGGFLFVGTQKELIRLEGTEPDAMEYASVSSQGVIPGSMEVTPVGDQAYFALQDRHVGSIRSNGEFRMVDEAVRIPPAESATTMATEHDGMEQYALQLQKPEASRAYATSYIEAEVIRRGNLVNQEPHGG